MTTSTTTPPGVAELRAAVAGPILLPSDDGYAAETAANNLTKVHRPALVVGVTSTDDVVAAVRWAAAHGWPVSVRATGHGTAPAVDGGLMLSTRRMAGVEVDAALRTVRVQAGARWDAALPAATAVGLAPLVGGSPSVGVVGYTLGGGLGPVARTYGFAADHVLALELVTADGTVLDVTAESEPELFWALRGGTGAFGVVTSMTFAAPALDHIYGGGLFYAADDARDVLHAWLGWTRTLDERISTSFALMAFPDLDAVPTPLRGRRLLHVRVAHVGSAADGEALAAPLVAAAPVVFGGLAELAYADIASIHGDPTQPSAHHSNGALLERLDEAALDVLTDLMTGDDALPLTAVEVRLLGGAVAREPQPSNAVSGRHGAATLFAVGVLAPPVADAVPAAGRAVLEAMEPWTAADGQVNFVGEGADTEQALAAWVPDELARLRRLKDRLDPQDMFRFGPALR